MNLSRNAARALNFAVITVVFLLMGLLISTFPDLNLGRPFLAIAAAAVQIILFIVIDRVFKIESKNMLRQVLKCVLAAIGIFAITYTVIGVLNNNNYAVYTYGDTESTVSFMSAASDVSGRIVYAAMQLLPVLMFLSLVFDKAFFFPAASIYTYLCVLTNNTACVFGQFSEYNGIIREYTVSSASVTVNSVLVFLLAASVVVTGIDLCIHRPKKKHKTRFILVLASLALGVIFAIMALSAKASGLTFNIDAIKESQSTAAIISNFAGVL